MFSHPLTQRIIHPRLPAIASRFEIRNDFRVVAHCDCQLGWILLWPTLALTFFGQRNAHRCVAAASNAHRVSAGDLFCGSRQSDITRRKGDDSFPLRFVSGQFG